MAKNKTNKQGFSAVELIVVVSMIAILTAIAVPSLLKWLPSYRLKAGARDVYSDLQRARMQAIKTNSTVTLAFTSGTGTPCAGGSYTFISGAGGYSVSKSMINDICLSTPSSYPNGFLSNGLPSGAVGTIRLTHQDTTRVYDITQSLAGSIRLQ